MLALPVAVGAILRLREGLPIAAGLWPVIGCWFTGYLAFNAASGWLKAPPGRRPAATPPVLVWSALAATLGLVALVLAGPWLLGWVVLFGPLVAAALWLAATRRERSLAGGALTVVAASLMTLVARFLTPDELAAAWGTPAGARALGLTVLVLGYLLGTVFTVKTMIRERGKAGWVAASIGWHLAVLAVSILLAAGGVVGPLWPALFTVVLGRAAVMPAIAARRPVRPIAVGLVEVALSAALVAVAAWG